MLILGGIYLNKKYSKNSTIRNIIIILNNCFLLNIF